MADQRVVDYIRAQLPRGFTKEQIRGGLISQGWSAQKVDDAMREVSGGNISQKGIVNHEGTDLHSMNEKKNVPGLIKFFSIMNYIGAGTMILIGLQFVAGPASISSILGAFAVQLINIFLGIGIGMFILAVLYIFLGMGLWKGQRWARIVMIVFSLIGFIVGILGIAAGILFSGSQQLSQGLSINYGLSGIISGIIATIINGLIAAYMIFNKKVKEAFA